MAEQVGCWLSHRKAWEMVFGTGLTLICEDDVKFTDRWSEGLEFLRGDERLRSALVANEPVLLRLGRALGDAHHSQQAFRLATHPVMANPCYAINPAMACELLRSSDHVTTTVDVYTHRIVGATVSGFTSEPPLAYELSWSTGEIRSDIRPKQIYIDQLRAKLSALDPGDSRYEPIINEIRLEEARFERFRAYNALDWDAPGLLASVT